MSDTVVIGGNTKLKNTVSGQANLRNAISGAPKSIIQVNGKGGGMTDAVKEALLDCFEHVAWIDDEGQTYYQALYDALYAKVLTSISASFEQGQTVIYDDDSLDDLKQYLTVTANYDDGTTAVVTGYTLSGTLNPGTSTITVTYEGKKAYFTVTVTHRPGTVTITNNLTGCTNSNSASSATEGGSYSGTISALSGYSLTGATVSITMGGTDITSTAYNNGTISIAELTGNVVITITAVAVTLVSISAVYTQSGTVYDTDTLDSLKADLVVTATYSDSSTATVPSADYTLSGTLTEGTSTITVTYGGKSTTFNVTVTADSVLYRLQAPFESNGSNTARTGITLDTSSGKKYAIVGEFVISTLSSTAVRIWSNGVENSNSFIAFSEDSARLWGAGVSWSNGANRATANHVMRFVVNITADVYKCKCYLKDMTSGTSWTNENTYNVASFPENDIYFGNGAGGAGVAGFVGVINEFVIYDELLTASEIATYLSGE